MVNPCFSSEHPCKNSPCQNGAKCFTDIEEKQFYCKCSEGYEGKTCENRGNLYVYSGVARNRIEGGHIYVSVCCCINFFWNRLFSRWSRVHVLADQRSERVVLKKIHFAVFITWLYLSLFYDLKLLKIL